MQCNANLLRPRWTAELEEQTAGEWERGSFGPKNGICNERGTERVAGREALRSFKGG